ncbi:uncharacterized protein LOC121273069 [Carcharodon carcharias]|uniref:uncharacterized protein LOC121273069 n=1 Tax=Carcharodon carcharias TaxID=13397 RepID=UPI001B7DAA5F|nr:uncharacterized protein LOC121273069 [Carcharodon carcharias]
MPIFYSCTGDDVWIRCELPATNTQAWAKRSTSSDRRGRAETCGLLERASLRRGYAVSLARGASLVVLDPRPQDAGTYLCGVGGKEYRVRLRVVGPGFLEVLRKWWIPLATMICASCLSASTFGLVLKLRRKWQHQARNKRISRMMSSFFKKTSALDTQLNGTYRNHVSTMEQGAEVNHSGSGSTSYENLGSPEEDGGAAEQPLTSEFDEEQDVGLSYENLCAEEDQVSEDYLEPNIDTGSVNTDDYMEPDCDSGDRQQNCTDTCSPVAPPLSDSQSERPRTGSLYAAPKMRSQRQEERSGEEDPPRYTGQDSEGWRRGSHYTAPQSKNYSNEDSSDEDYAVPDPDSPVKLQMCTSSTYMNRESGKGELRRTGVLGVTLPGGWESWRHSSSGRSIDSGTWQPGKGGGNAFGVEGPLWAPVDCSVEALQLQLSEALAEIENIKAIATVSESTKQEAIDQVKQHCQEEVASLQTIMKESISNYEAQLRNVEKERSQWRQFQDAKEREIAKLRRHLSGSLPQDNLENEMRKAQEDAEKLRSIVMPMEQEIASLKQKLAKAQDQLSADSPQAPLTHRCETETPWREEPLVPRRGSPREWGSEESDSASETPAGADTFAANCAGWTTASGPAPSPLARPLPPGKEDTASLLSTGTLVPESIYLPPARVSPTPR